tara:strand:+ start:163 stop:393 length:231 start_codon:yes stop_codon:yes gene_type:complete
MSFNFIKDTTEQAKQKLLASNWQELQAKDEEMQKEIDDQLKEEMEEVRLLQIKQDNQEPIEDYVYMGMSREDEPPR